MNIIELASHVAVITGSASGIGRGSAIDSITSVIAFQSTIPVALGLLFTPWKLEGLPLLAAALFLVCGGIIYLMIRGQERIRGRYLLVGGAFYTVFLAAVVVTALRGG